MKRFVIDPNSRKPIPVAILTTADFDAATVDPLSVQFGPDRTTTKKDICRLKDIDFDGDVDLVLFFRQSESGIQCGDTTATLIGITYNVQEIVGTDSINTVGCVNPYP